MKKIIAFIYYHNKKDKRVSNIAYLQTFGDVYMSLLLPFFLISEILNMNIVEYIKSFSGEKKWLEYFLGITFFIMPLYVVFRIFFPEKTLEKCYNENTYGKNYTFWIRFFVIIISAVCLLLIFRLKGHI